MTSVCFFAQPLQPILSVHGLDMPDFFVPGFGISRRVIESHIRYYCGPEAIARPYVLQVSLWRCAYDARDLLT